MMDFLKDLALGAGEILRAGYGNLAEGQIDLKGQRDLVTAIDRESENWLAAQIGERFPNDGILAEESIRKAGSSGRVWILDPLDGTTNFVHRHPMFCVSIALADNFEAMTAREAAALPGPGEPGFDHHASGLFKQAKNPRLLASAVYAPQLRELFWAARNEGAWLNDQPIKVSSCKTLAPALVSTGFPYRRNELTNNNLNNFMNVALQVQGIRRGGSASLDLCYLAAGRFDAFWELYLKPWDTCPGILIVEEAGGRVTDFSGGNRSYEGVEIIATNDRLHGALKELITAGDPEWVMEERTKLT
jgi:myo-inositol-1(or 4)-monophosphatase